MFINIPHSLKFEMLRNILPYNVLHKFHYLNLSLIALYVFFYNFSSIHG